MEKQINIPRLRFPDFTGEWDKKTLREVTYKTNKKNKSRELLPVYSINNVDGFVPQSEQFEGVDSNDRGYDTSLYKIVENNTFAYNPARINVGSIGYSGNLQKVIVSSLYVCFKATDNIDDLFFCQFIKTGKFNNSVNRNGEGGVRIYLFYENFSLIKFSFPTLLEQQKIATFLAAADDKLQALKKKKALLEQYKKGVMQKLFSQELRFKDENGGNFPEWEVKKLGDIITIFSGKSPSLYELFEDGKNPFIKVEELNNCNKYQKLSRNYTDSTKGLIETNSIIFPKRGAAILNNKVRINVVPLIMDSNLMALKCNENIFSEFLYYFIFHEKLYKIADTSSIPQINNKHIIPYLILLPCHEEQSKIATFLSTLDEKINQVAEQIAQTATWKKGLLQKMFI